MNFFFIGIIIRSSVTLNGTINRWTELIKNFVKKYVQVFPLALLNETYVSYKWYEIRQPTKQDTIAAKFDGDFSRQMKLKQYQPKVTTTFYTDFSCVISYVNDKTYFFFTIDHQQRDTQP